MTAGNRSKKWQRLESNETWRRLRQVAERTARQITGRVEDAEDVAQAVLAAYGILQQRIENPEAWVTRVAANASLRLVQRRARETPTEPSMIRDHEQHHSLDMSDDIDRILGAIVIDQLLESLSHQQKEVLLLKYGFDWERTTIAEVLGITDETVKTHLKRALTRLRKTTRLESHKGKVARKHRPKISASSDQKECKGQGVLQDAEIASRETDKPEIVSLSISDLTDHETLR